MVHAIINCDVGDFKWINTFKTADVIPVQMGIRTSLMMGVNPFKIPNITIYDGVNHPADRAVV